MVSAVPGDARPPGDRKAAETREFAPATFPYGALRAAVGELGRAFAADLAPTQVLEVTVSIESTIGDVHQERRYTDLDVLDPVCRFESATDPEVFVMWAPYTVHDMGGGRSLRSMDADRVRTLALRVSGRQLRVRAGGPTLLDVREILDVLGAHLRPGLIPSTTAPAPSSPGPAAGPAAGPALGAAPGAPPSPTLEMAATPGHAAPSGDRTGVRAPTPPISPAGAGVGAGPGAGAPPGEAVGNAAETSGASGRRPSGRLNPAWVSAVCGLAALGVNWCYNHATAVDREARPQAALHATVAVGEVTLPPGLARVDVPAHLPAAAESAAVAALAAADPPIHAPRTAADSAALARAVAGKGRVVAEAVGRVYAADPTGVLHGTSPAGYYVARVTNDGTRQAEHVQLELPDVAYTCVTRAGAGPSSGTGASTGACAAGQRREVGTLQPRETAVLRAWTSFLVPEARHAAAGVLTFAEGTGTVTAAGAPATAPPETSNVLSYVGAMALGGLAGVAVLPFATAAFGRSRGPRDRNARRA